MSNSLNPREIAERGIAIYERKFRADYEKESRGRFAAIDIDTERAYVADFPEEAMAIARTEAPDGSFYLIHIGSRATFKISRRSHAHSRGV
jgi:hypothetical protein